MDAALQSAKYIRLSTFRKDGREVATPVWLVPINGKLYFTSAGTSGKAKRIRATKRVRVAPSDFRGNPLGKASDGTGRIVTEPELVRAARRAIGAKYGIPAHVMNFFAWLARSKNRVVIELMV